MGVLVEGTSPLPRVQSTVAWPLERYLMTSQAACLRVSEAYFRTERPPPPVGTPISASLGRKAQPNSKSAASLMLDSDPVASSSVAQTPETKSPFGSAAR